MVQDQIGPKLKKYMSMSPDDKLKNIWRNRMLAKVLTSKKDTQKGVIV